MPGLFGIISKDDKPDDSLFEKLAKGITPFSGSLYKFEDGNTCLGFKSLGMLDLKPQPFFNKNRSLCLFLWGEIFNHPYGKKPLPLILFDLYNQNKLENIKQLNGFFSFALWDTKKQKLIIGSDIYAIRPIFYYKSADNLIFASSPFAIAKVMGITDINFDTLRQFFSMQLITGNNTWIKNIRKLRYGQILELKNNNLTLRNYYNPTFCPENISLKETSANIVTLLEKSVENMITAKCALSLSGGGDSRLIAAVCNQKNIKLPLFTYGDESSQDIRIADKVAKKIGNQHHAFEIEKDYLKKFLPESVYNTHGYTSAVNFHGISLRNEIKNISNTCISGLAGNTVLGYLSYNMMQMSKIKTEREFLKNLKNWLNSGFKNNHLAQLVKSRDFDIHDDSTDLYNKFRQESLFETLLAIDYFEIGNQRSLAGFWLENDVLEFRDIFRDYDLFKCNLKIPAEHKIMMAIGREIWKKHFPELGKIKYQRTGLALSASTTKVLAKKALMRMFKIKSKPGIMNYKAAFASDLSDWLDEMLMSDESLCHQYLEKKEVGRILAEHRNIQFDNSSKIGILLTFEQVLRILNNK